MREYVLGRKGGAADAGTRRRLGIVTADKRDHDEAVGGGWVQPTDVEQGRGCARSRMHERWCRITAWHLQDYVAVWRNAPSRPLQLN